MKSFMLNGKKIVAREFDYNTVADIADLGVDITSGLPNMFSLLRGYVAVCMDTDIKTAGKVINDHMVNDGSLDEVIEIMSGALEDSDFFRAISKTTEENAPKSAKEKK